MVKDRGRIYFVRTVDIDWIESAAITTGRSDVATVVRGTDDWVAYVAGAGGPSWPAGWRLVTEPLPAVLISDARRIGSRL